MPLTAVLLASVAPEVKTMSLGLAPIRLATCCRRARTKERGQPSSRREHDERERGRRTHRARLVNGLLSLPAERVRLAVRVAPGVGLVGEHGVEHARVHRGGGLGVEVDRTADVLAAACRWARSQCAACEPVEVDPAREREWRREWRRGGEEEGDEGRTWRRPTRLPRSRSPACRLSGGGRWSALAGPGRGWTSRCRAEPGW